MTLEERRKVLHIICDLEDSYKWRQVYKAFLETIVITQTLPPGNWHEGCELIANNPQAKEILATPFVAHYDFVTEGLDEKTAQALLDTVREERRRMSTQ